MHTDKCTGIPSSCLFKRVSMVGNEMLFYKNKIYKGKQWTGLPSQSVIRKSDIIACRLTTLQLLCD